MGKPRLSREALELLRESVAQAREPLYLVGGALRDLLLERPVYDLDLASAEAAPLARRLAKALGGAFVELDGANAIYRVAFKPGGGRMIAQLDVAGLQGKTIEEDLARRDFTVDALALRLDEKLAALLDPGSLIDPRGGAADIKKGVLRSESERLFADDPLRLLRAFRLAAQLGLEIEAETLAMIKRLRHRVRQPAGERVHAELVLMLAAPGCARRLVEMDEAGLLTALISELEPARKCAEQYYGPGGVMKHSLAVAARADLLLSRLAMLVPDTAIQIEARLAAEGPAARATVVLAALLHDIAKPDTAKTIGGRLRFFGHDTLGAQRARPLLERLRAPRAQIERVCAVIAAHLRPGHLAAAEGVTERAAYRFFRDLGEHALALLLVAWSDHASHLPEERILKLAKTASLEPGEGLGRLKTEQERKTLYHLQLVASLLRRLFDQERAPVPERLIDGHELMKELDLPPGPKVGELLERLREAQAVGQVKNRADALELLRRLARAP